MKSNLTHMILTAGLSALLGTAGLSAQSLREVADVPFTFHAQQQAFAAGQYQVRESHSNGILELSGENGKSIFTNAMVPVTSDPTKPHLTFACYGGECVLAEVAMPGRDVAYRVPESQIDKNLTHKLGIAAMISVPVRAR